MADAYLRMVYVLELSDKDMRLICLGLANKLNQRDMKDANDLNLRLLKAQQVRINEQKAKIDGAIEKALQETNGNESTPTST